MQAAATLALALLMTTALAAADPLARDFWSADAIEWGDGRPYEKPVKKEGPYPQGFKADFRMTIPADGWYEVIYTGGKGGMRHDLLVDGAPAWRFRTTSAAGADAKAGNLWLTAGEHVIRVQRIGRTSFPIMMIGGLALRPAAGRPEASLRADKTLVDVVRAGESLEITVTGGGGPAASYEILSANLQDPAARPAVVASVAFAASARPETKTVRIPCPAEGGFALSARIPGGRDLTASEFAIGEYAVVDVKAAPQGGGAPTPVHAIDCAAQTDQGAPLAAGSFLECNGPTRVVASPAGAYRESHDSTPPEAAPMSRVDDPGSYSGFSYRIDLPQVQVPYLIDVEFPDDARRSVTICQNWIDEATGGFARGTSYSAKAYETGGMQPLSGAMRHHRAIVWAASKRMILGILTQQAGHRAAVARITVSRFAGDQVPATKAANPDGRVFCHWYEEAENWRFLVNVAAAFPEGVVHDLVGLDRWARLCRYFGINGISACGAGYQSAFWRTTTLEGVMPTAYDQCRLAALICEKYGMRYTPEVFPSQWYMNLVTLPALAERPEDVRSISCHGAERGPGTNACDLNPLHPVVQQAWIDGIGEMADKLRDSPAFAGVTVRADEWLFRGDYTFPSLHWGYGDWTIRRFAKDTGIAVPGRDGDPARFLQRFEFLTSEDMRQRWIDWRCRGILDYHQRLRDRIRGGSRTDLYFGIAGDFICDRSYDPPRDIAVRARECGVDLALLREAGGLAVIANGRYGFRNLGVPAQRIYDDFLDPANVGMGMGAVRGFAAYMNYHELATFWPAEKLGIAVGKKPIPYYCSAAIASGRNSLEKFAVVLAEQDSAFLRDGGNTDVYGDPEVWNPWFAEFTALPAVPFQRVEQARDPVAVWTCDLGQGATGFCFYAVNREQFPVRATIRLRGADSVVRLGTGEKLALAEGVLTLDLAPFELRSFRAAAGAGIAAVATAIAPERITAVRDRLAFAQDLARALAGPRSGDLAASAKESFSRQVEAAWDAIATGRYWRARTALSMADALAVYEDLGAMPEGQVVTAFPGLMQERPHEGHWKPKRPVLRADALVRMLPAGATAALRPSHEFDPAWRGAQVLAAGDGQLSLTLTVPADGPYQLRLGHVAAAAGVTTVALDGASLAVPIVTGRPGAPETAAFPTVRLKAGTATLTLRRDGPFGLYALQLLPRLRPMPNPVWSVAGPFPGFWGLHMAGRTEDAAGLKRTFDTAFPPEAGVDLAATYTTADGRTVRWQQKTDRSVGALDDLVVSMPIRTGSPQADVNYAVTFIASDSERLAQLHLGVDWWAVAWLNGERLTTSLADKERAGGGGADFTSWYPYVTSLKLKKGVNVLLIKQNGGSQGSAFAAWITDEAGITCSAKP